MEFLSRLSARQKARASLSLLGLNDSEKESLDTLVADTMGNPIVGAVVGIDAVTLEELLENFFMNQSNIDGSLFASVQFKLADPKFRGIIASACTRVISSLPEEHQVHAANAILRISDMDIPEFDQEFENVEHFLRDGVLAMLANTSGAEQTETTLCVCENCKHVNYLT